MKALGDGVCDNTEESSFSVFQQNMAGWGVGCGAWGVGRGVWGVGCGVWGVGCGVWGWGGV